MRVLLLLLLLLCSCGRFSFDSPTDGGGDGGGAGDGDTRDVGGGDSGAITPRIRSVYRALAPITGMTSVPVTIAPVDPTRTFVICDYRSTDSAAGLEPMCQLQSGTRVLMSAGHSEPTATITWTLQVVEFAEGVTVQRGLTSFGMGVLSIDVPIATPVRLDRSFVVLSRSTTLPYNNGDHSVTVMAELSDDRTLRLSRRDGTTSYSLDVAWQVIELSAGNVQSGVATMPANQTMTSAPLGSPVALADTFLATSAQVPNDIEGDYLVQASLNPTNVAFVRSLAAAATVDVSWFAITAPGIRVVQGSTPMGNLATNVAALPNVDPNRSFVVSTTSGGTGINNDLDGCAVTAEIVNPSTLQLDRAQPDMSNVTVTWFVVEWPN